MDMDMDMGSNMFEVPNMALARDYWYIIAGFVGGLAGVRLVNYIQRRIRLRRCQKDSATDPSVPTGLFQPWATLTAIFREMSYPQLNVPYRYFTWLTPPPLGKVILLLCYWAVIVYMMTSDAVIFDIWYWERIGFRNAWVTVTQVPLLYLLASKVNVIGFITGISFERLNWLHRWVARTMFVTASMHGWHFYTEYSMADQVELEISMMPMVKWGLGAWAILLWMNITAFAPFRRMAYEVFVAQHVLGAIFFIYCIYTHVPSYAVYNVYFAIAALCFDRLMRWVILFWQNLRLTPNRSSCQGTKRIGHETQVRAVGDNVTIITIKDVHFRWQAGQHLYLWLPRVGPLEAHPYTIACAHQLPETCICNSIQLVVRKHKGFSRRVHEYARENQTSGQKERLTAFLSGPYGKPPQWDIYETLILISASTGASFTLPILESVLQSKERMCTKRVEFVLTAKKGEEIDFYIKRMKEALMKARNVGIQLCCHIAVTGTRSSETGPKTADSDRNSQESSPPDTGSETGGSGCCCNNRNEKNMEGETASSSSSAKEISTTKVEEDIAPASGCCCNSDTKGKEVAITIEPERQLTVSSDDVVEPVTRKESVLAEGLIREYSCRPDVEKHIREPVEAAGGETSVVVCGGPSLVSRVRNCVARLSDERAVHKGTGAQGIHLHVEEYSF